MRKNKKGFTLIEIIVVVVVLAVLMAVAVPSVLKYIHEADDAKVYTVVRTYMNDIEIAKAKAMIDDQDKTSLTWADFEKDIAGYLAQEKFYSLLGFASSQPIYPENVEREDFQVEGYYIYYVAFTAKDNTGTTLVDYDVNHPAVANDTIIDFSKGVNFTEYKFRIANSSQTEEYIVSCVPNGKITVDKQ